MPELVIDLGVPGPGPTRPGPGHRRRAVRSWWAARRQPVRAGLVAGLMLALLAGSAAPAAGPVPVSVLLPAAGEGRFEVVGGLLFVVESRTRWGAYQLPTGQRRWSLERAGGASVGLVVSGQVLVDQRYGFGRALDPATGAIRWAGTQDPGESISWSTFRAAPAAGAGVVAGYHWSTPDGLSHRFAGLDLANGAVRWRALPASAAQVVLAGDPPRVVSIGADGRVELRAPDTGRVLASRLLPGLAGRAGVPAGVQVALVAGRLVLTSPEPDALVLRGYAVATLARQWRLALPAGPDGQLWRRVQPCGPMLCVEVAGTVVDPVTGAVAWRAGTGQRSHLPVGDRLLRYDQQGQLRALVDARTGRVLQDLSGWRAARPVGAAPEQVLLTRPAPGGTGTRVARLDPAGPELSELGWLPGQPEVCRPYPGGLVCRHHDRLWVWPLAAAE